MAKIDAPTPEEVFEVVATLMKEMGHDIPSSRPITIDQFSVFIAALSAVAKKEGIKLKDSFTERVLTLAKMAEPVYAAAARTLAQGSGDHTNAAKKAGRRRRSPRRSTIVKNGKDDVKPRGRPSPDEGWLNSEVERICRSRPTSFDQLYSETKQDETRIKTAITWLKRRSERGEIVLENHGTVGRALWFVRDAR